MADFFKIIFKPNATLDKLLTERSMRKSWQATWLIVGVSAVFYLLLFLLGGSKAFAPYEFMNEQLGLFDSTKSITLAISLVVWFLTVVWLLIDSVLSRFWFAWYVRMGLRMVGGETYATLTPSEKSEKSRLVQLIQPYTYSICLLVGFLGTLLSLLVLPEKQPFTEGVDPTQVIVQMLGSSVTSILSLGAIAYSIVQRVFAIRKIYGVSGAKAFWGPFIPYAISFVLIFLVVVVFFILLLLFATNNFEGVTTF
ncbi:hypothetical protein JJB07_07585 [Tumebacillus sp. ITR2]|uniref:Yip1 domain-containing protein n=1 Tax=Tumebacillus amylolyticus TaxID=2801339 RepID=A0ABS1J8A8_9BACL|nr:hypothetical protein [Tumebacillus amylolyticus]MBL0386507.1 hypothetical protein [Tumebacillus amylolyticus]